jgi:hypothetical protein
VSLLEPPPDPAEPARLRLEAARTADRVRSMSTTRLAAALADGSRRSEAVAVLAQELVDASARISGRPQRTLPVLADTAVGDLLAVCAEDLAEDLTAHPGPVAQRACRAAVEALIALRRSL